MSTKFTNRGIPMADSQSLRLLFASIELHDQFTEYVAEQLCLEGFDGVSPAMLHFLSALDCGINYGAEIARRLKVSRQMVAKTVKELGRAGYLEQIEGVGKQKPILFTEKGERLMAAARSALADLDAVFSDRISAAQVKEITAQLEVLTGVLAAMKKQG
ncbi:MAG: HTH domain-containing protein [Cyanobacteria bacterium P01_F01_bin.86]